MLTAGLDGYPHGWVAVVLRDGRFECAAVYPTFAAAAVDFAEVDRIGVDMPIGLVEAGFREADLAARRAAGRAAASVFLTPPRPALTAPSYAEANAVTIARAGKGLSRQAWALRAKVLELAVLQPLADHVIEVHPEVTFRARAGCDLASKRTWTGLAERLDLLRSLGIELPTRLSGGDRARPDDVVDAAIVAWATAGLDNGDVFHLPERPRQFDAGRPILIWGRRR